MAYPNGAVQMSAAAKWMVGIVAVMAVQGATSAIGKEAGRPATGKILEIDITRDLFASSGEPQIAIDPQNPKNIAIIEFRRGLEDVPIYSVGSSVEDRARTMALPYGLADGDISLSTDGGNSWRKLRKPRFRTY